LLGAVCANASAGPASAASAAHQSRGLMAA
jgi:hypothetical protein